MKYRHNSYARELAIFLVIAVLALIGGLFYFAEGSKNFWPNFRSIAFSIIFVIVLLNSVTKNR